MNVATTTIDESTIDAEICLEKEELSEYVKQTKANLLKEVAVEGFRKGKAPAHIAEQQLNEQAVRSEALEIALEDSFTRAARDHQWDVARTSELKIGRNDAEGMDYHIRVHLWPQVKLPELASVKIARRVIAVSDQEVSDAIDALRAMRATFLDKTDPAQEGDRVEIDFDGFLNQVPIEGGSGRGHALIIGGKEFLPGFEAHLVGLRPDAQTEFTITAPADYYEQQLAGKEILFKVTVRRVQSVAKPTADDAFAKSVGNFETIKQLQESVGRGIADEKSTKEQQRLRLAILEDLIAHGTVPAPAALIHEELDHMMGKFSEDLRARGIELAMHLARIKKTEEDLRTGWRAEAERQVRITLALREVIKQHQIQALPDEVDAAVQELLASAVQAGQVPDVQHIDQHRIRDMIAERIVRDKALALIEATCAIVPPVET